ncbi:Uu.00g094570.m01.CDS01 [Anthostomella pinea]|uniref:Uu.00g094570.m01.CDS01 n=1 Tax=Anthostomella pinea TaxID=933095 RepID=A0AAI8VNN3_9PEZI|nr:Uu.00g094570.m01.CDS01 [Anthostomella pinea]
MEQSDEENRSGNESDYDGWSEYVSGGPRLTTLQHQNPFRWSNTSAHQHLRLDGGVERIILLETARKMLSEGGARAAYRGVTMGLTGMFPYSAIVKRTFELLKTTYVPARVFGGAIRRLRYNHQGPRSVETAASIDRVQAWLISNQPINLNGDSSTLSNSWNISKDGLQRSYLIPQRHCVRFSLSIQRFSLSASCKDLGILGLARQSRP